MINKVRTWWKQRNCEHFWRPARLSGNAAKWCDYCDRTVELSEPEFYAVFGRMPWS